MTIYAGLLIVILALIVVHAPLQVFFGSLAPDYALYIKAWKEILMLVALPLGLLLVTRAGRWDELVRDRLVWLVSAYALLHVLALLQWQGLEASLAGLVIDLRYVLYFALVYILIVLAPQYRRVLLRIAVIGAGVVVGFGLLQLALPRDFLAVLGYSDSTIRPYNTIDRNDDFIRYQSTLRGPNPYGAYVASVAVIALAWLTARGRDWRVMVLGAGAVVATYFSHARSAFVALAFGVMLILTYRYGRRIKPWLWVSLASLAIVGAGGLFLLRDSYLVSNVLLHEDPVGGSPVSSNDEHWRSLTEGTAAVLQDPLGDGVGSSGSASILSGQTNIIENQYLMIAHEVGWLGLVLFASIFVIVLWRLWQRRADPWALGVFVAGIGLALIGIILPVWADDTVSIVWWGLAGILLAGDNHGTRPRNQKTTRTT